MRYEDYVNIGRKPKLNSLICQFYFEPNKINYKRAAGAIAAESSIGTWTALSTMKNYVKKLAANVFYLRKKDSGFIAKISYPIKLFELNNIPNILSGIAGNIFGMKEIKNLKLLDINFPNEMIRKFRGPRFGIHGIRKLLKVYDRPLIGTIIKPKLGLRTKDHAKVAFDAWLGGCDIVKDDENLSSQSFNSFKNRLRQTLKMKRKAEKLTGEKKVYMINITTETNEMIKRAEYAKKLGNEYIMMDIITCGWASLQTLRNANDKLNLVVHAHRAMHAAFTRNPKHGISMLVIVKLARLIGIDQLHIGTAIGKMSEDLKKVKENINACKGKLIHIKPVFPVCSGGLHPGHIPYLVKTLGKDIIIQMGGGIHGHPLGTFHGAKAARQALDAVMKGISLKKYAKSHRELKAALKTWKR